MIDHFPLVISAAFVASTISAIAGTGGGVILLPVLVSVFGVREAVPIYAVAQLIGNLSRVGFNRSLIDYSVVKWFAVGAIPFALAGSWIFTRLPDSGLIKILGIFLVVSVIVRRLHPSLSSGFRPFWFAPVGGIFSIVSAIVGSAGPFLAPFYLTYGLTKGAFIGTEALGTAIMHVAKLTGYQGFGAITSGMWCSGMFLAPVMIAGSFTGKKILDRLPTTLFLCIVDAAVLGCGVWFLLK